jgi:hypothetical protein
MIQKRILLKVDEENCNSKQHLTKLFLELATNYKEDGNFNFKHSKYRMAILSYTEGIKAKSINNTLNAELHNNRAAANFFLKNYRFVVAFRH